MWWTTTSTWSAVCRGAGSSPPIRPRRWGSSARKRRSASGPETDQEEVAQLVAKYNLIAVPVVDNDHRLLGVITVDDVIDVIREEATEDIRDGHGRIRRRGAGASSSTRRRVLLRLPGVMITICTQLLGGLIIARFEQDDQPSRSCWLSSCRSSGDLGRHRHCRRRHRGRRGLATGDMTSEPVAAGGRAGAAHHAAAWADLRDRGRACGRSRAWHRDLRGRGGIVDAHLDQSVCDRRDGLPNAAPNDSASIPPSDSRSVRHGLSGRGRREHPSWAWPPC